MEDFAGWFMRTLTKPSTAKCTAEHHTAFLLAQPLNADGGRLSEVSGGEFAHDAATRFLNREQFSARDLFEEVRSLLRLEGGLLSVDDTVLDKRRVSASCSLMVREVGRSLEYQVSSPIFSVGRLKADET